MTESLGMAVSAKILLFAGLTLLVAAPAFAEDSKPVAPGERCEGTLCDLYYGSRGNDAATPAQPAAAGTPTPVVAPSGGLMNWFGRSNGPANAQPAEPPSATNSYMSMGGGGLLGGGDVLADDVHRQLQPPGGELLDDRDDVVDRLTGDEAVHDLLRHRGRRDQASHPVAARSGENHGTQHGAPPHTNPYEAVARRSGNGTENHRET